MHFNQPFYGTGNVFSNGQFYSYNPPPITNSLYPDTIVGEGDVNSITLPDGTCQFFFTPTTNWWTSQTPTTYPSFNMNYINPSTNRSIGTWFVRSITNPGIPTPWNNILCQRCEMPSCSPSLTNNTNVISTGFQKFHNDKWTSTTDIHFFYPNLRIFDYTLAVPNRGCASVQVDTPTTTMCHYEVTCSKPCHCNPNQTYVSERVSAMSLDTKTKSTEAIMCQCYSSVNLDTPKKSRNDTQFQLLPSDARKKRIKLERKTQTVKKNRSRDVICECTPPVCLDKCIATKEPKKVNASDLDKSVQCQNCCGKDVTVIKADSFVKKCLSQIELWLPRTNSSQKNFDANDTSDMGCSCSQHGK